MSSLDRIRQCLDYGAEGRRPHAFVNRARTDPAYRGLNFCGIRGCQRTSMAAHDDWTEPDPPPANVALPRADVVRLLVVAEAATTLVACAEAVLPQPAAADDPLKAVCDHVRAKLAALDQHS